MPSGQKPRPTTYTQYWIQNGWIYHPDQSNSAKYWITDNWIYGPVGGGTGKEILTGYWIQDDWIWALPVTEGQETMFTPASGSIRAIFSVRRKVFHS